MGTEGKCLGTMGCAGFSCCFEFLNQKDMLRDETFGRKARIEMPREKVYPIL